MSNECAAVFLDETRAKIDKVHRLILKYLEDPSTTKINFNKVEKQLEEIDYEIHQVCISLRERSLYLEDDDGSEY